MSNGRVNAIRENSEVLKSIEKKLDDLIELSKGQLKVQAKIFSTKSNGDVEIQQQDFYRQTLDRMERIEGSLVAVHNELAKKV